MNIVDPLTLKPGGMLIVDNYLTGEHLQLPSFTCYHCNRVVIMHPQRKRPRNTCKRCMKWTCDSQGCAADCNPFERDAERALADLANQPWMLRHWGEPIDRIYVDGQEKLILRRDNGFTLREMKRQQR